jgi:FkbM family methyltransferase
MGTFSKAATTIRHSKLLKDLDWLWNIFRKPYHLLLNPKNNGVALKITNHLTIRIPPQYYTDNLAEYERESTELIVEWITNNPECYVMDLGCSLGYISAVSLFASQQATVIGFDSDISSLKASHLMCRYAPSKKFDTVYGLITNQTTVKCTIDKAINDTNNVLSLSKLSGKPGTTSYVNLDTTDDTIPKYTIDELYKDSFIASKILMKCDIEGAELLALQGANIFIDKYQPAILLSVHPHILPVFNCTVQQVRDYLEAKNYSIEIISIDHEEHWWCNVLQL